ncbi:MAG: DNA replication/repair protein RecF [Chloroflexota bacterium]
MHVERLTLRGFRNYERLEMAPAPAINVLHGENGAGKTNILEALHLLGLGRSHRGARDADMARTGGDGYAVAANIVRAPVAVRIDLIYRAAGRKEIRLNATRQRKLSDLLGQFNVIIFSPEDLQLVKGSPVLRRRFLDFTLAQISPQYGHALAQYSEALLQRNNLLRDVASHRASHVVLDVWDEQLADHGAELLVRRAVAMRSIADLAASEHDRITDGQEQLAATYPASPAEAGDTDDRAVAREVLFRALTASRHDDLVRGQTLIGPHRDDIALIINGRPGRQFASQGQQRTAALAMKLAELSHIGAVAGESPVLLLDDVFSELDDSRRRCLLETISDRIQTFITTTNLNALKQSAAPAAVFCVGAGRVEREQ